MITVVSDNEISEDLKVKMGDSWKDYKVSRKVDGDTMTTVYCLITDRSIIELID